MNLTRAMLRRTVGSKSNPFRITFIYATQRARAITAATDSHNKWQALHPTRSLPNFVLSPQERHFAIISAAYCSACDRNASTGSTGNSEAGLNTSCFVQNRNIFRNPKIKIELIESCHLTWCRSLLLSL